MTDGVWHLGNGPSLSQTWPIRKKKRKRTTDTDTLQGKRLNWLQHHHPVLAPRCRHFVELRAVVLRMYVLVPVDKHKHLHLKISRGGNPPSFSAPSGCDANPHHHPISVSLSAVSAVWPAAKKPLLISSAADR